MPDRKKNILTIAGHDPTGGAGIQADIETITSMGCHACSIITSLTVQDTENVQEINPVTSSLLKKQLQVLVDDVKVDAIKIGLLGDATIARTVVRYLKQADKKIPVVVDPVLAAGGGAVLAKPELIEVISQELLPLTTILTPNSLEARQLALKSNDLNHCADVLLSGGCRFVLITGAHEPGDDVINQLYDQSGLLKASHWPRLANEYHGSGCTLSAAIAAQLAQGMSVTDAVGLAQQYTWNSLNSGYQPGQYQSVPNRINSQLNAI